MNTTIAPTGAALADQIAELTRGLAQLDRTRDDHVLELGRKLIPIRQLMQSANGRSSGRAGKDGLNPKGWLAWCDAAGIHQSTAGKAVHRAVNPERERATTSSEACDQRRRFTTVLRMIQGSWPNWTNEDRAKVIATIRELAMESNRGA